jgi:uncharacterized protein (DUF427 family)
VTDQQRGRVRIEAGTKWVRAFVGGVAVADTRQPWLVWEVPYYPAYYFPISDIRAGALVPTGRKEHSPSRGDATYFRVEAGGKKIDDAAWQYTESPMEELRDLVRFEWGAMDAWFEEDEEVYVHPRDPHTRVDILDSSRRVRVELDGVVLADSPQPRLLFETGLPTRFYLPQTDVRLDLLEPSHSATSCPYKGTAAYWSATIADRHEPDIAWIYRTPLPESQKIAGLVCFYNERVDLYVDGELQEKPRTKFSPSAASSQPTGQRQ